MFHPAPLLTPTPQAAPDSPVPVLVFSLLRQPKKPKRKALSYQNQLTTARRCLSALIRRRLVAATGNPYATMTGLWTPHERTGEQKSVYRYGVELEGWPAGTTLESPGHISSLRTLDRLYAGFECGAIGFRVLSAREVARRERALGIAHDESRRGRNDCQVRHLRPVETRSKILRNGTGIKTAEWVTEEEDGEGAEAVALSGNK